MRLSTKNVWKILKCASNQELKTLFNKTAPTSLTIKTNETDYSLIANQKVIKTKPNIANLLLIGQWQELFESSHRTSVTILLNKILNRIP